jgi:hypothetical protein
LKASLSSSADIDKKEWNKLIYDSPQGSIFMETDYLDTILPGGWSGITVHNNAGLLAVMPVYFGSKYGIKYALQPIFAKYWGIAFAKRTLHNTYKQYSWKKKIINAIIACIPGHLSAFEYNFNPGFDYALPFAWKSYNIGIRHSYILDVKGWDEPEVFNNYAGPMKNTLHQAHRNNVRISEDAKTDNLLHILELSRQEGKMLLKTKYYQTIEKIFKSGHKNGNCFILTAYNDAKRPLASALYLKDHRCMYSVVHCKDKKYSNTDGFSLITHHAIMISAKENLKFDFLGSMIEPVESVFRKFNGLPVTYYNISKKSRLLSFLGK